MIVVLFESLLALAPAALLLWIIYHADTADKEPMSLIAKAFFFGVIICIPVAIAEALAAGIIDSIGLAQTGLLYLLVTNLFGVALIEEAGKMLAVYWTAWKKPAFNYVFDGIVYAGSAALGFAAFENLIYVVGSSDAWTVGIMRALLSVPGHLCDGVFMGLFLGYAKRAKIHGDERKKRLYLAAALIAPITEHMIYDSICSLDSDASFVLLLGFVAVVYILAIWIVMKNRGQNDQKFLDEQTAKVEQMLGHAVGTFDSVHQAVANQYYQPQMPVGQVSQGGQMGQPYGQNVGWGQTPGPQGYFGQPYGGAQYPVAPYGQQQASQQYAQQPGMGYGQQVANPSGQLQYGHQQRAAYGQQVPNPYGHPVQQQYPSAYPPVPQYPGAPAWPSQNPYETPQNGGAYEAPAQGANPNGNQGQPRR